MMNRKEFYEYVKDNVKEYLPESYKDAEIKLQEVEKNNGLKLTGITIPNGNQRIVPTVYLDSLYQEYINGKDVDSCVGDVADMRIEAQGKAEFFDMGVPDILEPGYFVISQILFPHHSVLADGSSRLFQADIWNLILSVLAVTDLSHSLFPPFFLLYLLCYLYYFHELTC